MTGATRRWLIIFIIGAIVGLIAACCRTKLHLNEPRTAPTPLPSPVATLQPVLTESPPEPPPAGPAVIVPPQFSAPPTVRVWLSDSPASPHIKCAGACDIRPQPGQAQRVPRLDAVVVREKEGFRLGNELLKCETLDIFPVGAANINVEGTAYAGSIRFIRAGEKLALLSVLNLEEYLEGVLGAEMPATWPAEALKAQAVAARTYALYSALERADQPWDLTCTTEDQVYAGGNPPASVRNAVAATRGVLLLHEGGIFPAFFHSTCGGGTRTPGKALGRPEFDFLQSVHCDVCRASRFFQWQNSMTRYHLTTALKKAGVPAGDVTGILVITGTNGQDSVEITSNSEKYVMTVVDFRRAVGRMAVGSGNFTCEIRGDEFIFSGHGLGHGAGMCQYGAKARAERGADHVSILRYYYRNCEMKKLY